MYVYIYIYGETLSYIYIYIYDKVSPLSSRETIFCDFLFDLLQSKQLLKWSFHKERI